MNPKAFIRRYIDIDYYANGEAEKAQDLVEECEKDLDGIMLSLPNYSSVSKVSAVESEIKKRTSALSTALSALAVGAAAALCASQAKWLAEKYDFSAKAKNPAGLAEYTAYNGKDTISTFAKGVAARYSNAYTNAARNGYVFGLRPSDIVENAKTTTKPISGYVNSDIVTMVPFFAKLTDRLTYAANGERVESYVWCATLDGRTCISCGELSGMRFSDRSKVPACPLHNRCRCFLMIEEKGEHLTIPSFQEFIDDADEDVQIEVLGKKRWELYKKGMPVEKFVNNGKVITLKELDTRGYDD